MQACVVGILGLEILVYVLPKGHILLLLVKLKQGLLIGEFDRCLLQEWLFHIGIGGEYFGLVHTILPFLMSNGGLFFLLDITWSTIT